MKLADGALAVMRTGGPSMTEVVPLVVTPRKRPLRQARRTPIDRPVRPASGRADFTALPQNAWGRGAPHRHDGRQCPRHVAVGGQ